MKKNNFIFWFLSLIAVLAIGCAKNDPAHNPEEPSKGDYVRLSLFSSQTVKTKDTEVSRAVWQDANGSGDLTLAWESVDFNSDNTSKYLFVLSDGEKPISNQATAQANSSSVGSTYSGLAVTPSTDNAYQASLSTVRYYATGDLENASYCYAVTGNVKITEDANNGHHLCRMEMPANFTQSADKNPDFLRDYMYMYATSAYKAGNIRLKFSTIPATFRFIVNNFTLDDISLEEISITSATSGEAVASKSADMVLNWSTGGADLSFSKEGYAKVAVAFDGATLKSKETYTAYAMALPLSNDNAFDGKKLNFNLLVDGEEQIALELDGRRLTEINNSDVFNWVSGKSYTIKIDVGEDGKAKGTILSDNRIKLVADVMGEYTLMYEDANKQPLEEYAAICTLSVDDLAYYEDFIDVNVAPQKAHFIGIYDAEGARQGTIDISGLKPNHSQTPLYSFGMLSDVHIGRDGSEAEADFTRALEIFNEKGVVHTCISGDLTQYARESEYQKYSNIASTSETPVYATTGNHDCGGTTGGTVNLTLWQKYTGGHPLVYEQTVEVNGKVDHFLFLGMTNWVMHSAYIEEHLVWLEDKLEEYRNERCFIITHLFFPDRAGNMNDKYPSGNWLAGLQLTRLKKMCDHYVNTIWFSGHSHWEWAHQKDQDRANIFRGYNVANQPTSGWCVHIPSCGIPNAYDFEATGSAAYLNKLLESEGAIIEVYDDHIDILGMNLKEGKYLPIATYRLDTSIQNIAERVEEEEDDASHYIKADDFVPWSSSYDSTVEDVEGMPNYVDITFTAKGQKYFISNSTYTAKSSVADITVEDVKAFVNGQEVAVPSAGIGFYHPSKYYLESTDAAQIINTNGFEGVQFGLSSSKYTGPVPITIRMKAQLVFYD